MGRLKDSMFDYENDDNTNAETEEREYPVRLQVDGYDVNHFYDGDVPVYEIYGSDNTVIGVAHSTYEMHEISHGIKKRRNGKGNSMLI